MNIKTLIPLLLILLFTIPKVNAQDRSNNEFSIGYGRITIVTLVEGVYAGEDGYTSRPILQYSGTFTFTYRYTLSRRLSIGIAAAYENESGNMEGYLGSSNNGALTTPQGTFKRNVYSIAPEFIFHYTRQQSGLLSAYCYLGIGYSILNELDIYSLQYINGFYYNGINSIANNREVVDNHSEVTVQICPIGISVGGKLRGFAELGFGYKGIFNCGLAVKL